MADAELCGALVWREEGIVHIDVRGLEAPLPLVAVLRLLERPQTGDEVVFHHDRDPLMLYAELSERGWTSAPLAGEEGEFRLRLCRADR
jgi:hypothetical protein